MSNFESGTSTVLPMPAAIGATYEPSLLSLSGRIGRLRYWIYGVVMSLAVLPLILLVIGASVVTHTPPGALQMLVVFLTYGAVVFYGIVLIRRRLNDLNKTGWLSLLVLVPFVNFVFGILMLALPGTPGPNNFGPPPSENSRAIVTAASVLAVLAACFVVAAFILPFTVLTGAIAAAAADSY